MHCPTSITIPTIDKKFIYQRSRRPSLWQFLGNYFFQPKHSSISKISSTLDSLLWLSNGAWAQEGMMLPTWFVLGWASAASIFALLSFSGDLIRYVLCIINSFFKQGPPILDFMCSQAPLILSSVYQTDSYIKYMIHLNLRPAPA